MWRDIERRAKGYGFFAKTPVPYPLSEFDLANQIAILGFEKGWGEKFVMLTYKKWFQEGMEPAIEPGISDYNWWPRKYDGLIRWGSFHHINADRINQCDGRFIRNASCYSQAFRIHVLWGIDYFFLNR